MKSPTSMRGWLRPAFCLVMASVCTFGLGWLGALYGQAPSPTETPKPSVVAPPSDASQRIVATIYGNQSITREEFGEYLIARHGAEKLELYVNKCIIDRACKEQGIEVTAAEVEASIADDCKLLNVDKMGFVNHVLKQYGKTLYEWKEDVIRPRLLLAKLCREKVKPTEPELQACFEAHYGEKVDCRIILFPPGSGKLAEQLWPKIHNNDEEFDRAARTQANANLAAVGGHVKPIGRHTGNDIVERAAYSLKPGEVTEILHTPDGELIIKCVARVPADTKRSFDKERDALTKEVADMQVTKLIPDIFKDLKAKADPRLFMQTKVTETELKRSSEQLLKETADTAKPR